MANVGGVPPKGPISPQPSEAAPAAGQRLPRAVPLAGDSVAAPDAGTAKSAPVENAAATGAGTSGNGAATPRAAQSSAGNLPRAIPLSTILDAPSAAPPVEVNRPVAPSPNAIENTPALTAGSPGSGGATGRPADNSPRKVVAPSATVAFGGKLPPFDRAEAQRGPAVAAKKPADESPEGVEHLTEVAVQRAPPWLISAAVHMAVVILLGLIIIGGAVTQQVTLRAEIYAEDLGDQLDSDSTFTFDSADKLDENVLTPDAMPVPDPFATPAAAIPLPDGTQAVSDLNAQQIGLALLGRTEGARQGMLSSGGGTETTEAAVRLGLQWLARQQQSNGSWSLSGPYSDGLARDTDNPEAATAMALLAFQGHGVTHKSGDEFHRNVERGWRWLARQQDKDGNFFHEGEFNHRFYTQGQCTIAACEIYAMTRDPEFRDVAERAVKYCINAQSPEGGWRYSPRADSDVSVTGWIVMALQSAKMAGLEVPDDTFRRVGKFLDRVAQKDGSRYSYQLGGNFTQAMTAEGLLCRQYLGWDRTDPRLVRGANWLVTDDNLISFNEGRDVYYWYYATQVCHHMEGDWWKRWNTVMRQSVPEHQEKRGKEAGSWDPNRPSPDQWAPFGGRLYVTCLSIYMLEVYYRHMPLYSKVYNELLRGGRNPAYAVTPQPPEDSKPSGDAAPEGGADAAAGRDAGAGGEQ